MAQVAFDVHTKLSPEQVMSMLTDFSPRRPELWPTLARDLYCVHKIMTTSAEVQEGGGFELSVRRDTTEAILTVRREELTDAKS
jgi:hypothetical protein